MKSFRHAVAVVTGAGSGIGRALARALAAEGSRLALSDIDEDGLDATAADCRHLGAEVHARVLDVADRAAFRAYADDVADHHGVVHLVVNNAGVALLSSATQQTLDDVDRVLDVNLRGVITGSQAFLPHLIASGDGHLVNISSLFGLVAMPTQSAYNAAKFGVRGYTEAVRQDMRSEGHPVQVHCVHPGGVATNIVRSAHAAVTVDKADTEASFDRMARTSPERAAEIILRGVRRGRPRILVGPDAVAIYLLSQATGTLWQRGIPSVFHRLLPSKEPT